MRESEPIVLLTSIFDEEITGSHIREAYKLRWDIEEHFKILKGNFLAEKFRSKNLNGVLQEIFTVLMLINMAQGMTLLTIGPKTRRAERQVSSPSLVLGIIKKVFPILIHGANKIISHWLDIVNEQIHEPMSRFRPGRSYRRFSHRPIGR